MILSRRAALNGNQLDQEDSRIVIRSLDPGAPQEQITMADLMGGSGSRITGQHVQSLDAIVSWAVDIPKKQLYDRQTVFDKVNKWALQKGWLTFGHKSGKRLWVDKVILPSAGDLFDWTKDFQITFRALSVPFWQDSTATTSSSGSITVPGTVTTVCSAEITNASGSTIDTMTVTVGNSSFEFSSLGLLNGEKLVIGRDNAGIMYIRIYNGNLFRSVMDKRSGGSADDLYVEPGSNTITITGGTVTATVSCYGRYV